MMKYVIGVDLGTSAVKVLLVNQQGQVTQEVSKDYPLIQEKQGIASRLLKIGLTKLSQVFLNLFNNSRGILMILKELVFPDKCMDLYC